MLFLKGALIGLIFGVPAGAVGAMCAREAAVKGMRAGFITGLGSSAADLCYALVGVLGLTFISNALMSHERAISIAGSALILAIAFYMVRAARSTDGAKGAPSSEADGAHKQCGAEAAEAAVERAADPAPDRCPASSHERAQIPDQHTPASGTRLNASDFAMFPAAFITGLTNPASILTFLYAFSAFGIRCDTPLEGAALVAGIFSGTVFWWAALSGAVCTIKRRMRRFNMRALNLAAGGILAVFAIVILVRALIKA